MSLLDLDRLAAAPLNRDPFDYVVVEHLLRPDDALALAAAFPAVPRHGSFPLDLFDYGPPFADLVSELTAPPLRRAIEKKFAIDLTGRPTLVTVRGKSDGKDGRIHPDSANKLITFLLYMNPVWERAEGRLRILRSPSDLNAYACEVAPIAGTMLAFRRSETSYHGHLAHKGERHVLQLNWVTDESVVRRELSRHRWSARLKALNPFG